MAEWVYRICGAVLVLFMWGCLLSVPLLFLLAAVEDCGGRVRRVRHERRFALHGGRVRRASQARVLGWPREVQA